MWDHSRHTWREEYTRLPTYRGDKILLVPKNFVRRALSINSQEYLNKHVLEYLQAEHLRAGSSLVEVLVNGKRRVTKVSLRDHYPCTKTWMADFSAEHPEILKTYKTLRENIARVQRQSEADALNVSSNEDYVEATYAQALIENLMRIPAGNDAATEFHNITKGIIEFLFWPSLINPVKEFEIHSGRKRIDIMCDNTPQTGFFSRILASPKTASLKVPIECKNYSADPKNPEIDQLAGRFSPNRGRLGFLIYRTTRDYSLLIERCRDTAVEDRGIIIPLGDVQVIDMLNDIVKGKRANIDQRLSQFLDRIIS